jgi:hypothetical protein
MKIYREEDLDACAFTFADTFILKPLLLLSVTELTKENIALELRERLEVEHGVRFSVCISEEICILFTREECTYARAVWSAEKIRRSFLTWDELSTLRFYQTAESFIGLLYSPVSMVRDYQKSLVEVDGSFTEGEVAFIRNSSRQCRWGIAYKPLIPESRLSLARGRTENNTN